MGKQDEISWTELKAIIWQHSQQLAEQGKQLAEQGKQIAELNRETDRRLRELNEQMAAERKETDRKLQQLAAQMAAESNETDRRLRELNEQMAAERKETDRKLQQLAAQMAAESNETDRRLRELSAQMAAERKETERQLRELGRQIGGIGDKFGYFAEGMALPTMEKLLRRKFHMQTVNPRSRIRKGSKEREYDVLAWSNGKTNELIIVEVKSRVKREAIGQLIEQVETVFDFVPELQGKARMAILAGIDWDAGVEEEAQEAGLYTARIRDEMFELTTPKGFKPRRW